MRRLRSLAFALAGFGIVWALWVAGAIYVQHAHADLSREIVGRLYPTPLQVVRAAAETTPSEFISTVGLSTYRVLVGFALAAIFALPVGFAIGRVESIKLILEPVNDFIRYLPVAGFSTLTIFLIGISDASAIAVVFLGTAFHLVVATADAVRRVPTPYLDLGKTMHFDWFQRMRRVVVPASAPAVFDNLRVSIGWAWSYVTLAEVMGTEGGLGHAIEVARRFIRTDQVLFWIATVGLLGLVSDQLMRLAATRLFRWAQ